VLFFMHPPTPISSLFPYTTLFRSNLVQDNNVVLAALATYGKPRQSAVNMDNTPAPAIPTREHALQFPSVAAAILPEFTHHFDYRSEEHTSELQSRENLVCRLLLEK